MLGLCVLSILLATFLLPARAAKITNPRRALNAMLVSMVAADFAYAFFLYVIYPHMV